MSKQIMSVEVWIAISQCRVGKPHLSFYKIERPTLSLKKCFNVMSCMGAFRRNFFHHREEGGREWPADAGNFLSWHWSFFIYFLWIISLPSIPRMKQSEKIALSSKASALYFYIIVIYDGMLDCKYENVGRVAMTICVSKHKLLDS